MPNKKGVINTPNMRRLKPPQMLMITPPKVVPIAPADCIEPRITLLLLVRSRIIGGNTEFIFIKTLGVLFLDYFLLQTYNA